MKTLVLTERGKVIRRLYQERLGTRPRAIQNLSDEDAAILRGDPQSRSPPEASTAVSEPFTRTRLSANMSSRPRATPSSTVVAAGSPRPRAASTRAS